MPYLAGQQPQHGFMLMEAAPAAPYGGTAASESLSVGGFPLGRNLMTLMGDDRWGQPRSLCGLSDGVVLTSVGAIRLPLVLPSRALKHMLVFQFRTQRCRHRQWRRPTLPLCRRGLAIVCVPG